MVARSVRQPPAPAPAAPSGPRAYPLVTRLGLQELINREAQKPPDTLVFEEETWTALVSHVRAAWGRNKLAKMKIDQKLLACLRARRGVYSAAELAELQVQGGNIVWDDLTETKCKAGSAWTRDVILPVGEQPWGLEPTPVSDLPMPMKQAIVKKAVQQAQQVMMQAQQAMQQAQQPPGAASGPPGATPSMPPDAAGAGAQSPGGMMQAPPALPPLMDREEFRDLVHEIGDKLREDAEKTMEKLAKEGAKRMERLISDRLVEGGFHQAMDSFIEEFVTYPAAILKGPFYRRKKTLRWGEGWKPEVADNPQQTWGLLSVFDAYPAPSQSTPQAGDFIERCRFTRAELHSYKGLPGYHDDEIDGALRDYVNGHLEGWLWTEAERQRLQQETLFMWLAPPGVIDAINYWGSVPGWKLMSYGVPNLEETREYECNVLVCGRYVLYAAVNPHPLGRRPYRKACYDEIPGAFWGRSVPDLASTSQKMCNAVACAQANNLSIASGPQAWVHMDRLADGEQSLEIFPWKVWQLKSDPTQGVNPGIGFFQPPSNVTELETLHEKWTVRADDATGIPRYTYGNEHVGGAGNTLGGLSILMNSAAKGLRRGISNIDLNVIEPTIFDTFVYEMMWNPDHSVKRDCTVVPRGAAAILVRENAQQRRTQFLAMTANPIDQQIVGVKQRAALLRATAAALELPVDEVVPTDEELEEQMKQQAQAQQEALQAQQQAEIDRMKLEHELQAQSEERSAQRQAASKGDEAITNIVMKAVEQAMQPAMEAVKKNTPKKLRYEYNAQGDLVGGALE